MRYAYAYLSWHYTRAYVAIWRIVNNSIWFFYHFFSIPLLLKTLFHPWKNIVEKKKQGFDMNHIAERVAVNGLMRIVGIIIRLVTVTIGICFCIATFISGLVFTIFWFCAPLISVLSLIVGVRLVF